MTKKYWVFFAVSFLFLISGVILLNILLVGVGAIVFLLNNIDEKMEWRKKK